MCWHILSQLCEIRYLLLLEKLGLSPDLISEYLSASYTGKLDFILSYQASTSSRNNDTYHYKQIIRRYAIKEYSFFKKILIVKLTRHILSKFTTKSTLVKFHFLNDKVLVSLYYIPIEPDNHHVATFFRVIKGVEKRINPHSSTRKYINLRQSSISATRVALSHLRARTLFMCGYRALPSPSFLYIFLLYFPPT
jgi:hypothetical protein